MRVFDYISYRVNFFYKKYDIEKTTLAGANIVSLIQISFIFFIFSRLGVLRVPRDNIKVYVLSFFVLMLPLYIYNFWRYSEERYEMLKKKWENEPRKTRIMRGVLVVISMCSILLFMILGGIFALS